MTTTVGSPEPSNRNEVCPNCGYCPCCKRTRGHATPGYYPYIQPIYPWNPPVYPYVGPYTITYTYGGNVAGMTVTNG